MTRIDDTFARLKAEGKKAFVAYIMGGDPDEATSLAVIALISLTGVAATAASGRMDWAIALPFSAGAIAGMLAGRKLASRLAGPHLQMGFAAVSALVAIAMIVKALS